jgi:hypothetical protein
MADWRPDGGRRPRQNPDPTPESPSPPPSQSPSGQSGDPSGDRPRESWRRRNTGGSRGPAGKSYLDPGAHDGDDIARAKLIRLFKILGSLGCLLAAGIWLLIYIFGRSPEAPVILVQLAEETSVRESLQDPHLLVPAPYHVETGLTKNNDGFLARINEPNIRFHRAKIVPTKINDNQHVNLAMSWGARSGEHKIVTYYVSATAVAAAQPSDDLWVIGNEGDPYEFPDTSEEGTQVPSWRAVSLRKLLEQLVTQSPKRAKVLVFLELTQPPPILEIGRLNNPIPKRVRLAHEGLKGKTKDRLCIVMACDDGQDNWSAPELGRTVFGHFVAQALAGKADGYEGARRSDADDKVTVEEVSAYLRDNVADWVARFRRAQQTPVAILPEDSSDLLSEVIAVTGGQDSIAASDPAPKPTEIASRIETLDSLWQRYRRFREDPYSSDPVELGILEARLIRLEQLAVQGKRVPNALWDLPANKARPPEPDTGSLYERTDLGRNDLDDELKVWLADQPPFLRPPPPKDEDPVPPRFSTMVENTWLVWNWLLQSCIDHPNTVIRQDSLAKAVDYLNDSGFEGGHSIRWQERQLLDLLFREIDWVRFDESQDQAQLSRAVSLLVQCRHHLQSNAIQQNPEVHFWIRESVDQADAKWRMAFDEILASRPEEALKAETSLIELEQQLVNSLSADTDTVVKALAIRDDAFWKLPHFLRWSILHLQVEENKDIRKRLDTVRDSFEETAALADQLRSPTSTTMESLTQATSSLEKAVSNLDNEFDAFVTDDCRVDNIDVIDATVYRHCRIALQSPLLNQTERKNLYEICESYWDSYSGKEVSKRKRPAKVDWTDELVKFENMKSGQEQWRRLTQQTWSAEIFDVTQWDINDSESGIDNHGKALDAEQEVRPFALFLGEYLPGLNNADTVRGMISTRYKLATIESRCWLADRVVNDMWGDGPTGSGQQYFVRLADHYRTGPPTLRDYRRVVTESERRSQDAVNYLKNDAGMKWKTDEVNLVAMQNTVPMTFTTPSVAQSEPSLSSVYILSDRQRFPILDASGVTVHGLPVRMDSLSQTRELSLPLEGVAMPVDGAVVFNGITALRGNHLSRELRLYVPLPPSRYRTVRFDKYDEPPPKLRVVGRAKGVFRVALILDGSNSTAFQIETPEGKSTVLDELKAAAETQVLATLRAIHAAGEARVMVKLIMFGEVSGDLTDNPLGVEQHDLRSSKGVVSWITTTKYRQASDNNVEALISLMSRLQESGPTPLYDSIVTGLESESERKADDQKSIVIALTDGVNDTPHKNQVGIVTLKGKIRVNQVPVHVLEFDNEAYHKKYKREAKHDAGKKDLEELDRELGDHFKYFKTVEITKFRSAIKALVPRTEYKIMAKGAGPNDDPIVPSRKLNDEPVSLGALPLPADVIVRVGDAVVRRQLTRELKFLGGEWFQLNYVGRRKQLEFPPHKSNNGITIPSQFAEWTSPKAGTPKLKVWLHKPVEKVGPKRDSVEFVASFQHQDAAEFTPRPVFLLAEIRRTSRDDAERVFDVYDYQYLPSDRWRNGEHYPFARFAQVPWYDDTERQPRTQAKMSLWVAFQPPASHTIELNLGDPLHQEELGNDVFSVQWTGNTVRVSVRSQAAGNPVDRWVVIIPKVFRAERSYAEDGSAVEHLFRLPADQGGRVSIQIINVKDVQRDLDPPVRFEAKTIGKQ